MTIRGPIRILGSPGELRERYYRKIGIIPLYSNEARQNPVKKLPTDGSGTLGLFGTHGISAGADRVVGAEEIALRQTIETTYKVAKNLLIANLSALKISQNTNSNQDKIEEFKNNYLNNTYAFRAMIIANLANKSSDILECYKILGENPLNGLQTALKNEFIWQHDYKLSRLIMILQQDGHNQLP